MFFIIFRAIITLAMFFLVAYICHKAIDLYNRRDELSEAQENISETLRSAEKINNINKKRVAAAKEKIKKLLQIGRRRK